MQKGRSILPQNHTNFLKKIILKTSLKNKRIRHRQPKINQKNLFLPISTLVKNIERLLDLNIPI